MRFTPTAYLNTVQSSSYYERKWSAYIKQTDSLSENIMSGSWVDVTSRIISPLPDVHTSIEVNLGQFIADRVTMEATDIQWWKDNVYNGASDYVEFKLVAQFGKNGLYATDNIIVYSGFLDERYSSNELTDTITFDVYTAQDKADQLVAENVTTRYVEGDVVYGLGNNAPGLKLFNILGLYVTNAAIPGYVLSLGSHTIEYLYNGGAPTVALDGGTPVALTANAYKTLSNDGDTERIQVYCRAINTLVQEDANDEIVVRNEGDTLPYQWYAYSSANFVLTKIYEQMGITQLTTDNLEIPTYDSRSMVSYIDNPPNDGSTVRFKFAIDNDGTDLYIAASDKIYRRQMSDNTYHLVTTLSGSGVISSTTPRVSKLMYSSRNNHLWAFWGQNDNGNGVLTKIDLTNNVTASVVLATTANQTWHNAVRLFDYMYDGVNYRYGVVYGLGKSTGNKGYIKFCSSSMVVETVADADAAGLDTGPQGMGYGILPTVLYVTGSKNELSGSGNVLWQGRVVNNAGPPITVGDFWYWTQMDGSGNWVQKYGYCGCLPYTGQSTTAGGYADYHPHENVSYYVTFASPYGTGFQGSANFVYADYLATQSYDVAINRSISYPTIAPSMCKCFQVWYDKDEPVSKAQGYSGGAVWFNVQQDMSWTYGGGGIDKEWSMWVISGSDYPLFPARGQDFGHPSELRFVNVGTKFDSLTRLNGILYGIDQRGVLFKYDDSIAMWVNIADFSGMTVRGALEKTLQAYNLISTINSNKTAYIYRRGDALGNPLTTGNSINISTRNVEDITEQMQYVLPVDIVEIQGANWLVRYDGTDFDKMYFSNAVKLNINNDMIPYDMAYDLVFYIFEFFKTARNMYTIPVLEPAFQYEPFDGANVTFNTTHIQKTASGVIYGVSYLEDGTMVLEVLI